MKKKDKKNDIDVPDFYFGGGKPTHVLPLPRNVNQPISNVKTLGDLRKKVSKRYG